MAGILDLIAVGQATAAAKRQRKTEEEMERVRRLQWIEANDPDPVQRANAKQDLTEAWSENATDEQKQHRGIASAIIHNLGSGFLDALGIMGRDPRIQARIPLGVPAGAGTTTGINAQTPLPGLAAAAAGQGPPGGAFSGQQPPEGAVPGNVFAQAPVAPQDQALGQPALPSQLAPQPDAAEALPLSTAGRANIRATPALLSGLNQQPMPGMVPISPESVGRAAASIRAAGPQFMQAMDQIDLGRRMGWLTQEQADQARQEVLLGRQAAPTKGSLQEQLYQEAIQQWKDEHNGQEPPAAEKRQMLQEVLAGAGTKVSVAEQGLQWALNAEEQRLGRKLRDDEKEKVYQRWKAGEEGDQPLYDPDKAAAAAEQLAPGQRNEEVLRGQPENVVRLVKGLVDYKLPLPGGMALANPKSPWSKAMALAEQYDPTFNASQYAVRLATKKDFTTGKAATNLRSINTLVGHLDRMDKSAQALGNIPKGTYGPFTSLANAMRTWYRQGRQEPAITTFLDDTNAVESELAAVFKGTGASDQEIKAWRAKVDASSSPEELKAHVQEAVQLMLSRLEFLQSQYETAMGVPFSMRFLSSENEGRLQRLVPDVEIPGAGGAKPTAPAPAGGGTQDNDPLGIR